MAVGDTAADAEGFGEGESGQGMDAGANVPDSGVDGGAGAYASNTAAVIDATMQQAKNASNVRDSASALVATTNYKAAPLTQSINHWDTQDPESLSYSPPTNLSAKDKGFTYGDESTYAAYEDAKAYSDKGWAPGQALTYTDEHGKKQLANLPAHTNAMSLSDLEVLRQQAYAAKASQQGWNVPILGNMTNEQIAQQAMGMMGGPLVNMGMGALSFMSQPYSEKWSGTAAERAALGYYGPGFPTGMPNVGPHMEPDDRNWDDARWGDAYDPAKGARVDSQGNVVSGPTSPAGGEVITVAAPAGASDTRVTQFKALYPEDWTATLTDEEIIEMVENPDQLRFWLSWRQT